MPKQQRDILNKIIEAIELPRHAYERAERRYRDLGEWFHREDSKCSQHSPRISPQGSFRLGTANRPLNNEQYDLDLSCNLESGISKSTITQEQLKNLVGHDLETYRRARNIKEGLDEKRRCWRLDYADDVSFHMDIVPCQPENYTHQASLKASMISDSLFNESLANEASELAVSITDNTDSSYTLISENWRVSNPEGYARWFESRMRLARTFLDKRSTDINASIESIPNYRWKTPLQLSVQLLKRHRDTMFYGDEDSKPISIIITTLAARAYRGESDVESAITNILGEMDSYITNSIPRIPNPVNPAEDFSDKWYSPDHKHLNLEDNFHRWLIHAQADFAILQNDANVNCILEASSKKLNVALDKEFVEKSLGTIASTISAPQIITSSSARPWLSN